MPILDTCRDVAIGPAFILDAIIPSTQFGIRAAECEFDLDRGQTVDIIEDAQQII